MKVATFNYCDKDSETFGSFADLDSPETLVIAFGATSLLENSEPLKKLAEQFPNSKLIGCSTSGEILGETINDDSLSVAVLRFEKTCLDLASAPVFNSDESFAAGERIAERLNRPGLRGIIVLSDGL